MEICEEKYPDILSFVEDLQHLDKASKGLCFYRKHFIALGLQFLKTESNAFYLTMLATLSQCFHAEYVTLKIEVVEHLFSDWSLLLLGFNLIR